MAFEGNRLINEWLANGAIGPVREVHVWSDRPTHRGKMPLWWAQGIERPRETPPIPATLDWDLWLGPAPWRPYHPAYAPFRWRGWWDFGTGALGDIGCHALDPIFRALKLGAPESVQAASSRVNEETYPLASMVTYQFPARGREVQANNYHVKGMTGAGAGEVEMPPVKLTWYDGGLRPPRPDGLPEGRMMGDNGRLLVGEKGFMLGNSIFPESRRQEVGQIAKTIPRSQGHYKEWAEACKGGKPAGSNFDWAAPLAEAVLLGNVALRVKLREELTRARLLWDSANLKVRNVEDANRFIRRDYRAGWSL
jgi:predicted dehydrogenase